MLSLPPLQTKQKHKFFSSLIVNDGLLSLCHGQSVTASLPIFLYGIPSASNISKTETALTATTVLSLSAIPGVRQNIMLAPLISLHMNFSIRDEMTFVDGFDPLSYRYDAMTALSCSVIFDMTSAANSL